MKKLSKKQIFDLQIKYPEVTPTYNRKRDKEWYNDEVYWKVISANHVLSLEFIRDFKDYLDWQELLYNMSDWWDEYNILNEDFIREFKDYVDWTIVSYICDLSEGFIREFKHKVDWDCILKWQKLTSDLIDEMLQEGFIKEEDIKNSVLQN